MKFSIEPQRTQRIFAKVAKCVIAEMYFAHFADSLRTLRLNGFNFHQII